MDYRPIAQARASGNDPSMARPPENVPRNPRIGGRGRGGSASLVSGDKRPLWSVVSSGEPGHPFDDHAPLAPGTVVEEIRRLERWDHQGCIESVFFSVAEMRVVGGSRAGEIVEVILGAGWEHEYDPRGTTPAWLAPGPEVPPP
jgi:hypothetical protein